TVPLCSTSGATSSIDLTSMAQESGLRSAFMQTRTLEVQTPDGAMPLYEALPDDANGRGIVVIQEAFGVNDHIEDVTRRLADHDESIPVDDVEQLRAALDSNANVAHEIVRYADAGHGFHCDQRPEYVPAAAKDAFQRTLDWFERHLK